MKIQKSRSDRAMLPASENVCADESAVKARIQERYLSLRKTAFDEDDYTFTYKDFSHTKNYGNYAWILCIAGLILAVISVFWAVNDAAVVRKVTFENTVRNVPIGHSLSLQIETDSSKNQPMEAFTITSSDDSIGYVEEGVLYGLKEGDITLTATHENGVCGSADFHIAYVDLEGAVLSAPAALAVGKSSQAELLPEPDDATVLSTDWASSDESVLTVDETGIVTAQGLGSATITATTDNGTRAEFEIETFHVPEQVILSSQSLTMNAGDTAVLTASVYPDDAVDNGLHWTTSGASPVTVDEDGVVTAHTAGHTVVSYVDDDGISGDCDVTVYDESPVTFIILRHETNRTGGVTLYFKIRNNTDKDISGIEFTFQNYQSDGSIYYGEDGKHKIADKYRSIEAGETTGTLYNQEPMYVKDYGSTRVCSASIEYVDYGFNSTTHHTETIRESEAPYLTNLMG